MTADLGERIATVIDTAAPPVAATEAIERAQRARRRAVGRGVVAGAVAVAALGAVTFGIRNDSPTRGTPRVSIGAPTTSHTSTSTSAPGTPAIGAVLGTLVIDRLGLNVAVREGVTREVLRLGPGHDPATPLPGDPGLSVIEGKRTTDTAPFVHADELQAGDSIRFERGTTALFFRVISTTLVDAADLDRTLAPSRASLALVTNAPLYSQRQRLIVFAVRAAAPPADRARLHASLALDRPFVRSGA